MKYLIAKLIAASFFIFEAVSQPGLNPADPAWGWSEYKQLKCDEGYNRAGNYCVRCNQTAGKFFNPATKQCVTCPTGTQYNAVSKSCECECSLPRTINPDTKSCECPGKKVFDSNAKTCECPANLPLWNGKYCVKCPAGTQYEPKQHQCYHCPEGFTRNPQNHTCTPGL